jgi:hypothetical protein
MGKRRNKGVEEIMVFITFEEDKKTGKIVVGLLVAKDNVDASIQAPNAFSVPALQVPRVIVDMDRMMKKARKL